MALGYIQAQEQSDLTTGDILFLGKPSSGNSYQHIDFPKKNIIIKRGGIANFNKLTGQKVVVHQIINVKDGSTLAILKKKNGKNFFRFFPKIQCHLNKALNSGELRRVEKENSLAVK